MGDRTDFCVVCGARSQVAIDLPCLPLTDSYGERPPNVPADGIDQQLLLCPDCGHGQLARILPPEVIYAGGGYSFRTSTSHTSSAGTEFFLGFLDRLAPGRQFRCALDVGCNDLYLLDRLSGRALHRVGVDPVWAGREAEITVPGVIVSPAMFETVVLDSLLPERADLVIARHTLEHMENPVDTISHMLEYAADDALILIEVPGFDALVRRQRYDQVFHQHLQYFSRHSLMRLLAQTGTELVDMAENYHHWGAALMACRKARGTGRALKTVPLSRAQIQTGYDQFRRHMAGVVPFIESLGGPVYGYGAAQMLPVLGYHMGTDFSFLESILDDDPAKEGLGYWNLPARVAARRDSTDLSGATVMITAVDNAAPIMRRLLTERPRHIVNPLRVI